jgi:iron(III) transport system permease protein
MQSIAGRGPGAALGVIAVAIVALGTYAAHRLLPSIRPELMEGRP